MTTNNKARLFISSERRTQFGKVIMDVPKAWDQSSGRYPKVILHYVC